MKFSKKSPGYKSLIRNLITSSPSHEYGKGRINWATAEARRELSIRSRVFKTPFRMCSLCAALGFPASVHFTHLRTHALTHRIQRALGKEQEWVLSMRKEQEKRALQAKAIQLKKRRQQP